MVKGVAYITINTDASFREGAGGYAFWIVSDEGKIQMSGAFKEPLADNHQAEMRCIVNALHKLLKSKWTIAHKIHINSDSMVCLNALQREKDKAHHSKTVRGSALIAKELMSQIALKFGHEGHWSTLFVFRHVKGHTKDRGRNARTFINDWCDKQARYHCRQAFNNQVVSSGELEHRCGPYGPKLSKDVDESGQVLENKVVTFHTGCSDSPIRTVHTGGLYGSM